MRLLIINFHIFRCYSRARDYCTSGRHVVNMCVNVIRVCVYLQNWSHVISYVNKATATPDFSDGNLKNHDHQTLLTRLHCSYGLAELAMRKYKSAAKRFLDANLDYCDIPDLMSTQVSENIFLWIHERYTWSYQLSDDISWLSPYVNVSECCNIRWIVRTCHFWAIRVA